MAKEFSLGGDGQSLANQAVSLVFLNPAATPAPEFLVFRLWASQQGSATSAQQRIQAEYQRSPYPTLVSATPAHLKTGDTVASLIVGATTGSIGTGGINASAEGAGAKSTIWGDNFNMLNGYLWVATPREVISMAPGNTASGTEAGLGLFLPAAATSLSNWAMGMNYGEDI